MNKLNIQDTFNQELPADPNRSNTRRQVRAACFSYVTPRQPSNPVLVHASTEMAETIGLAADDTQSEEFLRIFSGAATLEGTSPFAMCYGGHQFGSWAGQLGDGRAINLTEVIHEGKRWALQLKGAGETPYSRTADGLAVLRSSIREHLCSEAMYHLGVPTTRSLSLVLTGDQVMRDMLYNGNAAYEKGAVVCRVAPSFIRFGNFQIFTARDEISTLQSLTDYTIRHFFPHIEPGTPEAYAEFFKEVSQRTLDLVIEWQRVGFVHGVMNTDNMSILGLTIDYGPYGWLEGYEPDWTPNTTDRSQRRYRYGQQPGVILWNLVQLANALMPLVKDTILLEASLADFQLKFPKKYLAMLRSKLGLAIPQDGDAELAEELEKLLAFAETDMILFFRNLAKVEKNGGLPVNKTFFEHLQAAMYQPEDLNAALQQKWEAWLDRYLQRLQLETASDEERRTAMNLANPKYVLRNYMAQLAIDQADLGDFSLVSELYELLKKPYDEQPGMEEKWFVKRPEWARNKVGCSMLSCSS